MKFLATILAVASLAVAEPVPIVKERGLTCTEQHPKGYLCGVKAEILTPSIIQTFLPTSLEACRDACVGLSECESFLYEVSQCVLYDIPLNEQHPFVTELSPAVIYHRKCFKCELS